MARKNLSEFTLVNENNFTFTKKTITFSSYIYQVSNITYVAVEEYRTIIKPPRTIFLSSLVAGLLWIPFPNPIVKFFGFWMILVGIWGLSQGNRVEKEYGLIFETNSGGTAIFTSKNKTFLEEVINTFYDIMDGQDETLAYYVNIEKANITPTTVHNNNLSLSNSVVGGSAIASSKLGDVSSSVGKNVISTPNV